MAPEIEALILFEEMLNFSKDLQEAEKYANFAALKRQFQESQLLKQLSEENDGTEDGGEDYRGCYRPGRYQN